mgnify:FL=1|jgi:hypothetical protein
MGGNMKTAIIITDRVRKKRIQFGMDRIQRELQDAGYTIERVELPERLEDYRQYSGDKIYIGERGTDPFLSWLERKELLLYHGPEPKKEGFYLETCPGRLTVVVGGSDTGTLYGCLELTSRIREKHRIPENLAFYDAPVFQLRGPCVGLQKTRIEPPRLTYEYPITPDRFPWFYEKARWTDFLDRLLEYRCNVLYIWNGHPFSSLVKLKEYSEALEVTEEEFEQNQEMFGWLTEECDKRGIWVVLEFYNIHIPYPFAMQHGLEQRQSKINPLVADYTKKCIIEFIKSFPNIGLMVCLGEALRGNQNKTDWFVDTIIPAVKEGMRQAGLREELPVILRAHDCDPFAAIKGAKKLYSNLYTMWKYNGEGLTTYFPRGSWQKQHQALSQLGTTHILNVHILADLEPFRFQAPNFIMKCMQAGQNRLGGNGLHLYPLFYWDWPYSPDKRIPRLLQIDRDWMWYEAWFRYAWNPNRDEKDEDVYWAKRIAGHLSCSEEAAGLWLEAMESAGHCAPRILGRIGITEGNRQTFSLGMTMSQMTNVNRYRPNRELWNSVARVGEQPDDYVRKELTGEPHIGETPYDMIREVTADADNAWEKCHMAMKSISIQGKQNEEANRVRQDVEAICYITRFYCYKLKGAIQILKYKYTMEDPLHGDITLLDDALDWMGKSLEAYRKVTEITRDTYLYANSMQTPQRKIPFPDGQLYCRWEQCLPEYEKEYGNFKRNIQRIRDGNLTIEHKTDAEKAKPLKQADFKVLSEGCETYPVRKESLVFTDKEYKIRDVIPELDGLTGIRFRSDMAETRGISLKMGLKEDSQILIGYMQAKGTQWLQVPDLEIDTHADDRGGLEIKFENAVRINGCPSVNVHAFQYERGIHELYFGTGSYLVVGVIPKGIKLQQKNGSLLEENPETLDWLYGSLPI